MEFIYVVNEKDWVQLGDTYAAFIPLNCTTNDVLELNLLDNEEYIKEHQDVFSSLTGGIVLNGYGSVINTRKPDCDILIKITKHSKEEIEQLQQQQMVEGEPELIEELPEEVLQEELVNDVEKE